VIKEDGLAGGKGVVICQTIEEAEAEIEAMLDGKFGDASSKIVIEDFLAGREFSVFVLTDGDNYQILPIAKDYKKVGEGDEGPNTGGMGSVSPVSFISDWLMDKVIHRIIEPTIKGIREGGYYYKGIIFFGLIEVSGEPYVIEYNCRLGDPETQVVLPRLKSDLVDLFKLTCKDKLDEANIKIDDRHAATVIMVSGGYPGTYEKGKLINGLEQVQESIVFQAGTKKENGKLYTNGGRVLAVTSLSIDMEDAISKSYKSIEKISFEKQYFRRDIGFDV
jgi:phosphoribosylamine--glycine ligase